MKRRVALSAIASMCALLQAQSGRSVLDGFTPPAMAPGSPGGAYALSGFDTINPGNRNLNFVLPLHTLAGRGELAIPIMLPMGVQWTARSYPQCRTSDQSGCTRWKMGYSMSQNWWHEGTALATRYAPGLVKIRSAGDGAYTPVTGEGYILATRASHTNATMTAVLPDRTEIELRDAVTQGKADVTGDNPPGPGGVPAGYDRGKIWMSVDGSGATFMAETDFSDVTNGGAGVFGATGWLLLKNGTRMQVTDGRIVKIQDRNGNYAAVTYDSSVPTTITDTNGHSVTIAQNPAGGDPEGTCTNRYDTLTYLGKNGAARIITVKFALLRSLLRSDYEPQFEDAEHHAKPIYLTDIFPTTSLPSPAEGDEWALSSTTPFNPCLVSEVDLPDTTSYKFKYSPQALLARVELPTGGAYEYDQSVQISAAGTAPYNMVVRQPVSQKRTYTLAGATEAESSITFSEAALTRDIKHEVTVSGETPTTKVFSWTRHSVLLGDASGVNATTMPSWKSLRESKVQELDGSGTEVRRIERDWVQRPVLSDFNGETFGGDDPQSVSSRLHDPRVTEERTIWANGKTSKRTMEYDRYNNVTALREHDFGDGAAGALIRKTVTAYQTGGYDATAATAAATAHIRGLPSTESIFAAETGSASSTTEYYYDGATETLNSPQQATLKTGVTNHDDTNFGAAWLRRGNLTLVRRWTTGTTWVTAGGTYDTIGNLLTRTDGRLKTTSYGYDDSACGPGFNQSFSKPASVTYPQAGGAAAMTESWCWDHYIERAVSHTGANSEVESYSYDNSDRLQTISRADSGVVSYEYCVNAATCSVDPGAMKGQWTKQSGSGVIPAVTSYDGLGRVQRTAQTGTQTIVTDLGYEATRLTSQGLPRYDSETGVSIQLSYDALGRLLSKKNSGDNSETTLTPNGPDTVVRDEARTANAADGGRTQTVVDARGRLVKVVEDESGQNLATYYRYNALDQLTAVCQGAAFDTAGACPSPGQGRTFEYDGLGRLTTATNPEAGQVLYSYDGNGNLTQKGEADGTITSWEYDELNRMISRKYSGTGRSGSDAAYCYDGWKFDTGQSKCVTGTVSNGLMRVTEARNGVSSTKYTEYDAMGRVKKSEQRTGTNGPFPLSYTWNTRGQITGETLPSGRGIGYGYDDLGRTASVSWARPGETQRGASVTSYAAHGAPAAIGLGNGLTERWTYSGARQQARLLQVGTAAAPDSVMRLAYGYCADALYTAECVGNNGNVRWHEMSGASEKQEFTYDLLNRLTGATAKLTTGLKPIVWSATYGMDARGNLWFSNRTSLDSLVDYPDAADWFRGGKNREVPPIPAGSGRTEAQQEALYYDASGNRILHGSRTLTYDADGRVTKATGSGLSEYGYDAEGRRVTAAVDGRTPQVFVYDALGQLAAEYNGVVPGGAVGVRYVSVDPLGSVRAVTNGAGELKARMDYTPHGEELLRTANRVGSGGYGTEEAGGVRVKFTGKERDDETGLDYFGARYFSAAQGRFTSPDEFPGGIVDPFTGQQVGQPGPLPYADITDPQTINKYAYVRNNPLRYTDPDGHVIDTLADIGFIAYDVYQIAKGGATTTNVLALGADVVGAVVPFATGLGTAVRAGRAVEQGVHAAEAGVHLVEAGAHAAEAGKVANAGEKVLYRRGAQDTEKLLTTQAKAAEKAGLPHGVSVSTSPAARPGQAVRCATCSSVESAGFKVHKTGSDPQHYTVELPKPITKKITEIWNGLFK